MTRLLRLVLLVLIAAPAVAQRPPDYVRIPFNVSFWRGVSIGDAVAADTSRKVLHHVSLNLPAGRADRLEGVAVGVFSTVYEESAYGVQVAGLANVTGEDAAVFQTAGLAHVAGERFRGLQTSGLANIAGENLRGLQASLFNVVGGTVRGAQVGLANVTSESMGLQVGLVSEEGGS